MIESSTMLVIAGFVSAVTGGALGYLSSFLTNRAAMRHQIRTAALPRQMDALEHIARLLFRARSGENPNNEDWNQYIAKAHWLPEPVRSRCLAVLPSRDDEQLKDAQRAVVSAIDEIMGGSH